MKFTLNWLYEHLETDASVETLLDKLSVIGLEVEGVEDPEKTYAPFKVAKVTKAEKHPDADKLQVCTVKTDDGEITVVCGAHNARAGMTAIFAPVGSYVPGLDITLSKGKIRGVESHGMLVSMREMGLSDEHEGIIDLEDRWAVGTPLTEVFKLNDKVIEIAITPNRNDALGVRGIARDLAACDLGKLKEKPIHAAKGSYPCPIDIKIAYEGNDKPCFAFAGRVIRNVKNGPSPEWLQKRLKDIGLRPINALVDITNFISYDRARPLHVYDAAKLKGAISARAGVDGETFLALDGKEYAVDGDCCVISDEAGVLGLGGIIGGEHSGVTDETTEVFIESALFEPSAIAKAGRKLGIHSDARYRFERGVDPASCLAGLEQASQMALEICGGEASEVKLAGEIPSGERIISFDPDLVEQLTGLQISNAEIKHILTRLGFWMAGTEAPYKVAVPSWRPHVQNPSSLVEEVVRIVGLDRLQTTMLPRIHAVPSAVLTPLQLRTRRARRLLAGRGLVEAITWSFLPKEPAKLFGGGAKELTLDNPISVDMAHMRPSLLAGLLLAAQKNVDRGFHDLGLFEVGQIYENDTDKGQFMAASGLRRGSYRHEGAGRHWSGAGKNVDLFDAKADAFALLAALGYDASNAQITRDVPSWFHPGRAGRIQLGPKLILGYFGELHPKVLKALDIKGSVVAFELILDNIPLPKAKATRAKSAVELYPYQAVKRDFAFVVDAAVEAATILRAAQGADKKLITDVNVFDLFQGASLGADKKSVAFEVTIQPQERTLTDEEIEAISAKIIANVEKSTGGQLRG